jgi:hypothetical protein
MKRVRRNPSFDVRHADHGISQQQMSFVQAELEKIAPQGFFIRKIHIPHGLGPVPNGLWGPDSGDAPIPDSQVYYAHRGDRPWADRMIARGFRDCDFVQAIGTRSGDEFVLFTVYGGPLAPMHPDTPGNQDRAGSLRWWSQHALSDGSGASVKENPPKHAPLDAKGDISLCEVSEDNIVRWPRDVTCKRCRLRLWAMWQDRGLHPTEIPLTRWPWDDQKWENKVR